MQEFQRAVRGSGYERRVLVKEFKRGMNMMETERPPTNIE